MSQAKLNPNRGPPAKIALTSSMETTSFSPSTPSSSKDKKGSHKGLWKSIKTKASAFSIFERGKSPQPPSQAGFSPSPNVPTIPLYAPHGAYGGEDEEDKLKNDYDRTFRRSCDTDEHKKASARITITTASGEYDFAFLPKGGDESAAQSDEVVYATANASTTALSAVSHKTNADDALLDFPDLGSDLAKYIRDGTPTPSTNATPTEEQAPVFGFIPFDEKVESYDEDFELGFESPEGLPKVVRRGARKSVRFASAEIAIEAKKNAEEAVEVHRKMLADAKEAGKRESAKFLYGDADGKNGAPRSLLPRPPSPVKRVNPHINEVDKPRTPSPTKALRSKASATFISERSPSPQKQPLGHRENMTFRASRDESTSRPPRGLTSPSKTSILQHTLSSPSKTDLGYVSPSKNDGGRVSPTKLIASYTRPRTPITPTKLTMENTRLNTPTSPTKLTPIRSHTPTSPLKSVLSHSASHILRSPMKQTPVRSQTPTTPITAVKIAPARSHTPPSATRPVSSAHDSMMRGKEAHEEAAKRKAIEAAEMRKQTQEMLHQKKVEEQRMLREKHSKVALRRKASQGVLNGGNGGNGPASPALPRPVMASRLPVLAKKGSSATLRRPGMGAPAAATESAPVGTDTLGKKAASTVAPEGTPQLRPKDSKQSLRPKTSQSQLGQIARSAAIKPIGKSKLGHEMRRE